MPRRIQPHKATAAVAADPVFAPLVEVVGPLRIRPPHSTHYEALLRSIVFQQLAGKAAATIHGRVVEAVGGEVTPERIAATADDDLRGAGLSANKLAAIRDLTVKVVDGTVPLDDVEGLDDEEIVERLVTVRGIGRWTAEMFLLFQLRRPDVWPSGDLGVRAGWAKLHGLDELPTPRELEAAGERFRPWRSAAAWYCWRAVDTVVPSG